MGSGYDNPPLKEKLKPRFSSGKDVISNREMQEKEEETRTFDCVEGEREGVGGRCR